MPDTCVIWPRALSGVSVTTEGVGRLFGQASRGCRSDEWRLPGQQYPSNGLFIPLLGKRVVSVFPCVELK